MPSRTSDPRTAAWLKGILPCVSAAVFGLPLLGAVTNALAEGHPARLPVEAFAGLPRVASVKFSPSGKYFAVLRNQGGQTVLITQAVSGVDAHAVVTTDNSEYFINWFEWVSDERLLAGIRFAHSRGRVESGETRLIAVNRDGTGESQELIKPKAPDSIFGGDHLSQLQDRVIAYLPDDPKHVLIELDKRLPNTPNVYLLDVYTGTQTLVQTNPGSGASIRTIRHWMADRQGRVRVGIGGRPPMTRVIVRPTGSDEWQELAEFDSIKERGIVPLGFDYNPDILYIRAMHEGRWAIFKLDLGKPEMPRELVAADPDNDLAGQLIYARWLRSVVGVSYAENELRTRYWDKQAQRIQARVNEALPGRRNVIVSSSDDGRRHVVVSGTSSQATQYYIFDREHDRVVKLAETYPDLRADAMSAPESVAFRARDGLELHGYWTVPKGRDPRELPMVVFPHGGPWARDTESFNLWTQFFASRGWAVLQINFRGSRGYGEEFERAGFQRWGLEMQDDLADGVQWAIQQGFANAGRVCIVGGSYGGYAALMGVARTPDLYRCAVSFAGPTDLRMLVDDQRFYLGLEAAGDARIGRWWSDRDRLNATSPVLQAGKIHRPVLLLHGASDVIVPVAHSRDMVDALKRAGHEAFRYIEMPLADHWLSREPDRVQVFREMEQFLKTYLD
ncbi:MAG: S9 family peptidase [Nitrospira sp.]